MTKRRHSLSRWLPALLGLLTSLDLIAQPALLLRETFSREISVHIGGAQTPEFKSIVTAEVSVFVGDEPDPPLRQALSREVSVVVTTPAAPALVRPEVASVTPTGDIVGLAWSNFNQWLEHDVARYDIYMATAWFSSVAGMVPFATVPGETYAVLFTGLSTWVDRFFAVVAVDAAGQATTAPLPVGVYVIAPEVISREVSVFIGQEGEPTPRDLVAREVSVVVTTPAVPNSIGALIVSTDPIGSTASLDWSSYNQWQQQDVAFYRVFLEPRPFSDVTGLTPYVVVPGETYSTEFSGLTPWRDHFFAVVPVDAAGEFAPAVNYAAAYVLAREVVSREATIFVNSGEEGPGLDPTSREVSVVVATEPIPEQVTALMNDFRAITSVEAYRSVDMDWSLYPAWAQHDIARYRVYLGRSFFDDVTGMEPYAILPGENWRWTVTGLDPLGIYYVAVVAEDVLGQWTPVVRSASAQASIDSLGEVREPAVSCWTNALEFSWVPPVGAAAFLAHYNAYVGGTNEPIRLPAGTNRLELTGLEPSHGYPVRLTTVDRFGKESLGTAILGATLLPHPAGLSVQAFDGMVRLHWAHVEPNDLVWKYGVYLAETNFTSIEGKEPSFRTRARRVDLPGLQNGTTYYVAVTTINVAMGEATEVQTIAVSPAPREGLFADLALEMSPVPRAAYPGTEALFSWSVRNVGDGITTAENGAVVSEWVDRVILSRNEALGDADDLVLSEQSHAGALDPLQGYVVEVPVRIPRVEPGDYHLFVVADAADQVFEHLDEEPNEFVSPEPLQIGWISMVAEAVVAELSTLNLQPLPLAGELPPGTLRFELAQAPAGMLIDPGNGSLTWTPTEEQGPTTHVVTVKVTDNGEPPLSATNVLTIVVTEVNSPPAVVAVPDQEIDELTTLDLALTATDPDVPTNALTFALVEGPVGLTVSPTGELTWTPTEEQGPSTNEVRVKVTDNGEPALSGTTTFTVVVREVNSAPAVVAVPDQEIDEFTTLNLALTATDADVPANALTFALVYGPAGLTVSPTGGLTWTPTEQGPSSNEVRVKVTDDGEPALSGIYTFTVDVVVRNYPPELAPIEDQIIDELTTLSLTLTATDANLPPDALTFALVDGPAGLTVSPTGELTWTPTETQGPSNHVVRVKVTDDGEPALSGTNTFTVVVREVNSAPAVVAVPDQEIDELTTLNLTLTATDPDVPTNALTFALVDGPVGLTVGPTGELTWTPTEEQGPSTNEVRVKVTDDGVPNMEATTTFQVVVRNLPGPSLRATVVDGEFRLTWEAGPGRRYQPQFKDDLNTPSWTDLGPVRTATESQLSINDPLRPAGARYYRVRLLLP